MFVISEAVGEGGVGGPNSQWSMIWRMGGKASAAAAADDEVEDERDNGAGEGAENRGTAHLRLPRVIHLARRRKNGLHKRAGFIMAVQQ
eukprot:CAMPEP_0182481096 /NCGR_PEP_ID=MMETSP1319-20130603/36789_1 /TAXON_ID=172717 /ORGANISM="Bolidomonas pacifica, Strain RCC208" /LENGTH=88 /DNA_ID=CAMNT_0024682683 /DNA_START=514 /DNA_END=780 /DNA_ORIENTATION=+